MTSFLSPSFLDPYRALHAPFGWNGLGKFVFNRTYLRPEDADWVDVCARSINGMYQLQLDAGPTKWDQDKAEQSAAEAFDLLFNLKWSPPGRGLWMQGTSFVQERRQVEALQNCAFISSEFIDTERGDFFRWVMEMLMLGVGVGFDTRGEGKLVLQEPCEQEVVYEIADSREGWAQSVEELFNSYLGRPRVAFDFSKVRPVGLPIKGFGGTSSGPEPLRDMLRDIASYLNARIGQQLQSRDIVDICNMIGRCVIAGNVRRSAEIALGRPDDSVFASLKDYEQYPERASYGWTSNNTVTLEPGYDDYLSLAERTWDNGEPGYLWLKNAQEYGRMNGQIDTRDDQVMGVNPCGEQMLEHREMCTLVEIYLPRISSKWELSRAVKYAYLYGKSVTLGSEHITDSKTREVMLRNRRIGLSMTGVAQFEAREGSAQLVEWMDYAYQLTAYYDQLYSNEWLHVPESIRRTTVKPSGTVSLIAGVTPGVHHPISRYHIRRVSVADDSPLVDQMEQAGYPVEQSVIPGSRTAIIEFPVDAGEGIRGEQEVSLDEQLDMAAVMQRHWSDNGVSLTAKFHKDQQGPEHLAATLTKYDSRLKAASLLPHADHGYEQAPYEEITEIDYLRRKASLRVLDLERVEGGDAVLDKFCDGETCELPEETLA